MVKWKFMTYSLASLELPHLHCDIPSQVGPCQSSMQCDLIPQNRSHINNLEDL